jgi:hypothetical protein
MEVEPVNNYQPRPVPATKRTGKGGETRANAQPADTVEISLQARLKLAELADAARREILPSLRRTETTAAQRAPQKNEAAKTVDHVTGRRKIDLAQVQRRMETGFYNQPEVKEKIAERLAEELSKPDDKNE